MASPITPSTGLGSGLAIGDIVTALVNSDKLAKQTQITTQTKLVTTKISGIGTLQSAMTAFQTALTNLGKTDTPAFAGYAAKASDATKLTVTSDNSAVPGTYSINVKNLATASSVASASFAGGTTSAIPSGDLTLTQNGIDTKITIPTGATLASVAKQINAQSATSNISANIITDDNGSRLVFSSTVTGKGTDITASSTTSSEFNIVAGAKLDPASKTSAGYINAQAVDASLTVNGLTITSASNTIDKSLGGVSMTLLGTDTSTVTVSGNNDGLKTSLQTFVDAYNAVVKAVASVTKATVSDTPDKTTGATVTAAALTGDAMPRSILSAIRDQLVTAGAPGGISVLSQLGITTGQSDGTLSLDAKKFATAMDQGLAGDVQQLFSGTDSTNGLLSRMKAAITPYTQTGGIFDTRKTSLNKQQTDLTTQQAALDLRVTTMTATLTAKYNAMDLLVGQLKASATSITSFFDSLNAQQSG
ncbi:flagellar filament capping protein FliD [Pseudomonas petrae]|uniref:Flagellar hook-associated protein 2 n=2 Tax=Pseudomonas TaxID=286 RepID=A0ABS9I524_9PSED|nr:flagellar filament capping protein FliD [Pseudomonas petrae]MCF7533873.1 flagellar filament capping protein FliD [Pseudomonas petrae]MCF7538420.1 flagellar filament capping protein FliD [Pseudomonas petrae]MCF7542281.1 flagellar filament capping protein FliD [Pseudomonas petrae]MCF7555785.1 flagellar filament capping protein FliD [Pseudomonas petrae]